MRSFFLTATGTDIGKTYIGANLIRVVKSKGTHLIPLKPVMSGFNPADPQGSDAGLLMAAANMPITEENLNFIAPWRYLAPLAPDLAARAEEKRIIYSSLLNYCIKILDEHPVLLEGAGGIMSPLAEGHTCLDLASDLQRPVILVTGSYLGAMSHCLTAISAMSSRKCDIAAIIVNQSPETDLPGFCAHLREFTGNLPLYDISRPGKEDEFQRLAQFLDF